MYRAWQPSVGRQVALKCLLRAGDPKSAERFAREYRALGRVDHPHLVKVFTSGAEGDQWFYAMELIEGATLAAVCERLQTGAETVVDVAPDTWRQAVSTTCEEARRARATAGRRRQSPDVLVTRRARHPPAGRGRSRSADQSGKLRPPRRRIDPSNRDRRAEVARGWRHPSRHQAGQHHAHRRWRPSGAHGPRPGPMDGQGKAHPHATVRRHAPLRQPGTGARRRSTRWPQRRV